MSETNKISKNALIVVVGLVVSVAWIIIGLVETPEAPGLSTVLQPEMVTYVIIVTIASLVLIPICSRDKEGGFIAALVLGTIILVAETVDLLRYISGSMPEGPLFNLLIIGGVVWLIIQIPIIIFSYRAYMEL